MQEAGHGAWGFLPRAGAGLLRAGYFSAEAGELVTKRLTAIIKEQLPGVDFFAMRKQGQVCHNWIPFARVMETKADSYRIEWNPGAADSLLAYHSPPPRVFRTPPMSIPILGGMGAHCVGGELAFCSSFLATAPVLDELAPPATLLGLLSMA